MGIEKHPSKKFSSQMDVILMVSINDQIPTRAIADLRAFS